MLPDSAGSLKIGNYWVPIQGLSNRAIMLLGKKDNVTEVKKSQTSYFEVTPSRQVTIEGLEVIFTALVNRYKIGLFQIQIYLVYLLFSRYPRISYLAALPSCYCLQKTLSFRVPYGFSPLEQGSCQFPICNDPPSTPHFCDATKLKTRCHTLAQSGASAMEGVFVQDRNHFTG